VINFIEIKLLCLKILISLLLLKWINKDISSQWTLWINLSMADMNVIHISTNNWFKHHHYPWLGVMNEFCCSEEEWKFVKVNIWGNIAYFTSVDCYLVSQHAWCRDLNWIGPVIVVKAQSIGKVKDGILWDSGRILCHIEMSRFHCALSHIVRY